MLTRVMCYATTVCSTRVVRVGLCVRIFGRGFLPMYESREVSTGRSLASLRVMNKKTYQEYYGLIVFVVVHDDYGDEDENGGLSHQRGRGVRE